MSGANVDWPALPLSAWRETRETLHLWTQVVGKVRLAQTPWLNHSWHVPLYVTARGLTTSPVFAGNRAFDIEFDFVAHKLVVRDSDCRQRDLPLEPRSVADFHAATLALLRDLGLHVTIDPMPSEIADAIPFDRDRRHCAYDADYAQRFWRVLLQAHRVFTQFRTAFLGKCSPVHFFWGSFDLAVTRFSGRRAPMHPGGVPHLPDAVVREAYSHEVSSAGFWPGGEGMEDAAFYSYAYPEPPGYREARVAPDAASFSAALGEFVLPYDTIRKAPDPDREVLSFLQTTYEAAATSAAWDRDALECVAGRPGVPRPVA